MMWNQNDTKYIIKRLILYIVISCIVFFGAQSCAKAAVYSQDSFTQGANVRDTLQHDIIGVKSNAYNFEHTLFRNYGSGTIIFTIAQAPLDSTTNVVFNVEAIGETTSYTCNMTGGTWYVDNTTQRFISTVSCPYNANYNNGLKGFYLTRDSNYGTTRLYIPIRITFVTEESDASAIISANNQAIQNQINANNTNTQAIQNAINTATQNQINAINASTQATQDNTAAINAQTEWQQQDFNSDTTQIDAITDLISTGDKNKIRDLMMFPARILMLIGAHIGSDYCTAYNLGSLYGTNLILPCINWKNYVGSGLYNTIDIIVSIGIYIGLIIYVRKLLDYAFSLGATTFESVNVEVFN